MGWFVGISTRTPTTSICLTAAPSSRAPGALLYFWTLVKGHSPCQRTPAIGACPPAPRLQRCGKPLAGAVVRATSGTGPSRGTVIPGPGPGQAVSGKTRLGQGSLDERAVQPHRPGRYLPRGPPRLLDGFRIALPQRGRDHLLDERDLALRRRADGPQVPCLHAVPAQHRRGGRHLGRVPAVRSAHPADQPERLELGELLLVDPGRVQELAAAQRAAGRGARPA